MISIKAIFIIFYLLELGSLTTNNQVTIYKKMFTNVKKKNIWKIQILQFVCEIQ